MTTHPRGVSGTGVGLKTDHERRLSLLKWLIGFAILSTGIHFTHNFVAVDQYPDGLVSGGVVQAAILVTWPLATTAALYAYRLYARRRYREAHPFLFAYGLFAMVTLGHFLDGTPDIAPFWFATIFTDALGGAAVLAFTIWSIRTPVSA